MLSLRISYFAFPVGAAPLNFTQKLLSSSLLTLHNLKVPTKGGLVISNQIGKLHMPSLKSQGYNKSLLKHSIVKFQGVVTDLTGCQA
ncbi:hypothetical protein DSO57_1021648 [Entomophthora muscae]|uniref:Uncharacterized protein n=1 Tax=Entomophthora muscae TaxID=34485 RepID=A0ACC2TQT0_9FUNG|nr:hypothetical protein DSO57_1021648 [Entomophthora muscae]